MKKNYKELERELRMIRMVAIRDYGFYFKEWKTCKPDSDHYVRCLAKITELASILSYMGFNFGTLLNAIY